MELLPFKIQLCVNTSVDSAIKINVKIDQTLLYSKNIVEDTTIEFEHQLDFDNTHCLEIEKIGDPLNPQQTANIKSIFIDNINVKDIVTSECMYFPEYPEPWATEQKQKGINLEYPVHQEMFFGHNGIWKYNFSSPFYRHLLYKVTGV